MSSPTTLVDPARFRSQLRSSDAWRPLRFGLTAALLAAVVLALATVWVGTCTGAIADGAACGTPQRALLALAAPAVLFVAGLLAFVRAFWTWKSDGAWWVWQSAGLFLMVMMLLTLFGSVSSFTGVPS